MRKIIKSIFLWVFREEIEEIKSQRKEVIDVVLKANQTVQNTNNISRNLDRKHQTLDEFFKRMDISIDHHVNYSSSWAVVSIQGKNQDFIKFMDLDKRDAEEIQRILKHFEKLSPNIKIDAAPQLRELYGIRKR